MWTKDCFHLRNANSVQKVRSRCTRKLLFANDFLRISHVFIIFRCLLFKHRSTGVFLMRTFYFIFLVDLCILNKSTSVYFNCLVGLAFVSLCWKTNSTKNKEFSSWMYWQVSCNFWSIRSRSLLYYLWNALAFKFRWKPCLTMNFFD